MIEIPGIVIAAQVFLDHCRALTETSGEYTQTVPELSKMEEKVRATALEVLRLYFTEEKAYNPLSATAGTKVRAFIDLLREAEIDERLTDQSRLENRQD